MTQEPGSGIKTYMAGIDAKDKLRNEYGEKASVLQKAYEAAVQELGYDGDKLINRNRSQEVAMLMFSDKYLGNEEFNPLLKKSDLYKGFKDKDSVEQDILYEHMFDMTARKLTEKGGHIDNYGNMKRTTFATLVERTQNNKLNQQMKSFIWNNTYNAEKSLTDNVKAYNDVLVHDPILSQGRGTLDLNRQDLDSMTDMLIRSMMGEATQSNYMHEQGVKFERPDLD